MSYTPLTDVTTELEGLNVKTLTASEQNVLIIELLHFQITEQRITNKLLSEAFELEVKAADVNRDKL